jgi:hypothetical protein
MGQYFKAVNLDKQECVCPWCMSGGAKLWEWAANTQGAIFTLLLRKSDEGGPIRCPVNPIAGRWAGDRVCLVGDYDSSKLWDRLPEFRNITQEVVETWNDFIERAEMKLQFRPDCGCHRRDA